MNMMIMAAILFITTYILMLALPNYKHYITLFMALIFILLGILPLNKVLEEIDFNILLMIIGTMGTVSLFIESKMPERMADSIINRIPNVKLMIVSLSIFSGIISAFVDNVATVLMLAPITLIIAKKLKISPIPILIPVAIFSNIEGAATLVGDTTSILLSGAAKMDFLDFFFYQGKVGLFFIVQGGMLAAALVLLYILRDKKEKLSTNEKTKINSYFPSFLLGSTILTLIIASFFPNKGELTNGIICVLYFCIGLIIKIIEHKKFKELKKYFLEIDLPTVILLASLFVIIGGIKEAGLIDEISKLFIKIGGDNEFIFYTLIVIISIIISAFIDNIPYVATMLPVVAYLSNTTGIDSTLLYYGLIIGATLGGNFTPIGASANIAAIGILKKDGYTVKLKEYLKYSIPITLTASIIGYILILIIL